MKYKQHRVLARTPEGGWEELYQGRVGECRTFIETMRLRDRKMKSPVVTRRSLQEWLEQITPRGSQAPSCSSRMRSCNPTPTTEASSQPVSCSQSG